MLAASQLTTLGFFSLEAAKVGMEVIAAVEDPVLEAREEYLVAHSPQQLHHLSAGIAALWPKRDHLLYLPILGEDRPRGLYYYQGDGLEAIYGFTYKYLTLEHFWGQLTRVQVGAPLAESLVTAHVQAWYPTGEPLTIFADWHVKPHWTKAYSHAGHMTMWGRVMPGTKQLILNGPDGRFLGGWDHPVDIHMTHLLVDLEAALEHTLERPIERVIMDSEGGGLPMGKRYAEAQRDYISVLPRGHSYQRTDFKRQGPWNSVKGDPDRKAAFACWADPERAAQDPRQFVLMRPKDQSEPTRIYARDCLALAAETDVRTFAHVTGGGLADNLARVIPNGLVAELERGTWTPAPIFAMIAQRGRVTEPEMERTFNMGVGMVAVVAPEDTDRALAVLTARHVDSWVLGSIKPSPEPKNPDVARAVLVGEHPRF